MKPRAWSTLAVSAAIGASVWALSPWLVGHREPWDADGQFYVFALAIAGFVAGLLVPRPLWAQYLGAFVGQLVYELLFLRVGALALLGVVFLLGYSLVYLLAAAVAGYIRSRLLAKATRGNG
jgi:hypothetical protein